jgi:hypothetical protein
MTLQLLLQLLINACPPIKNISRKLPSAFQMPFLSAGKIDVHEELFYRFVWRRCQPHILSPD